MRLRKINFSKDIVIEGSNGSIMRRNMKKACYGQELLRNRPRLFLPVTQISFDYGI